MKPGMIVRLDQSIEGRTLQMTRPGVETTFKPIELVTGQAGQYALIHAGFPNIELLDPFDGWRADLRPDEQQLTVVGQARGRSSSSVIVTVEGHEAREYKIAVGRRRGAVLLARLNAFFAWQREQHGENAGGVPVQIGGRTARSE